MASGAINQSGLLQSDSSRPYLNPLLSPIHTRFSFRRFCKTFFLGNCLFGELFIRGNCAFTELCFREIFIAIDRFCRILTGGDLDHILGPVYHATHDPIFKMKSEPPSLEFRLIYIIQIYNLTFLFRCWRVSLLACFVIY